MSVIAERGKLKRRRAFINTKILLAPFLSIDRQ